MNCPVCGGRTTVVCGRRDCESVYRYRRCLECSHKFYTTESESGSEDFRRLQTEADRRSRERRKRVKA